MGARLTGKVADPLGVDSGVGPSTAGLLASQNGRGWSAGTSIGHSWIYEITRRHRTKRGA
jgi:hypothetical protein